VSRSYEMSVRVTGVPTDRHEAVVVMLEEEYDYGSVFIDDSRGWLVDIHASSVTNLCAGKAEEEYTEEVAKAIWKLTDCFCRVEVTATYLEMQPYEDYSMGREDYERLTKPQD
jgi:hypothetical protein